MERTLFESTPKAYIAPYPGGASELLEPFVGDPCVVSTFTAHQWIKNWAAEERPYHALMCIRGGEVPVVLLEHTRGNCFLYVIVDPTDPSLWPVLDKWKERGCYVNHMTIDSIADVTGSPLNEENFGIIDQYRHAAQTDPAAFADVVSRVLSSNSLQRQATEKLRQSGAEEDVEAVVEVNILTSAAISQSLSLNGMAGVSAPTSGVGQLTSEPEAASGDSASVDGILDSLDVRFVEFGELLTAKICAPFAKSAASMKPKTPVLASSIDLERFMRHSAVRGVFGFGHFKVDDRVIISFRLQSGSVQIYWLADATDPDVWRAIKRWKAAGEAGFVLADDSNSVFIPWKLQSGPRCIEEFAVEVGKKKATDFIDVVSRLVESGDVHRGATSDIDGVALEYVHVNVLMTKRLGQAADAVVPAIRGLRAWGASKPGVVDGRRGSTLH